MGCSIYCLPINAKTSFFCVCFLCFFAFISKSVNNRCYNPYFTRKDLTKNVWVLALIVYRFRDKRKKRNETEMILLKWGLSFNLRIIRLRSHASDFSKRQSFL